MQYTQVARAVLSLLVALVAVPAFAGAAQTSDTTGSGQVALYQSEQVRLANEGRDVVNLFLNANDAAFLERSSVEVQDALADVTFERMLQFLETNRLFMRLPATNGEFGGHYNGSDAITGYYLTELGSFSFRLSADENQTGDVPTGLWSGIIQTGEEPTEFTVEFSGTGEEMSATIDIPSMDLESEALEEVEYAAEQPIGDVVGSQALPISPTLRIYAEAHDWGSSRLVVTTVLDESGTIQRFRFTPIRLEPQEEEAELHGAESAYRLPADELLFVFWSGHGELPAHHADSLGQRQVYEFMVWQNGSIHAGDGTRNEDYHIWGMSVVAPAAGTVVAVENGVPDHAPGQASANANAIDAVEEAGNYVVVQVGANEWAVIAHLQQGSVQVNVGDQVQAGDQIALAGNSGSSRYPMLHLHAQSTVDLNAAEGSALPLILGNYVVNGGANVPVGVPVRGQFIAPTTGSTTQPADAIGLVDEWRHADVADQNAIRGGDQLLAGLAKIDGDVRQLQRLR